MKSAKAIIRQIARIALPAAAGVAPMCMHGQIPDGPPTAIVPSFSQDYQVAPIPGQPATPTSAQPIAPPSPFVYGPFSLEASLSYQAVYETGVQAAPGKAVDTTNQTTTAGLTVQAGAIWNLAYSAAWTQYSSSLFHDAVDQNATFGGNFSYQNWKLDISQSFSNTSDPQIETGTQIPEQTYGTNLTVFYDFGSSRPSLEVDLGQSIIFASLYPSTYTWTNQDWVHLPISPQLDLGIGPAVGYTHEDPGFNMEYFTPQAKIDWRPTTKVTVEAESGVQESRYLTGSRDTSKAPVFSANIVYQPSPTTSIGGGASRQVTPSLFANVVDLSTSFNVQASQRLLAHYYFSVQASSGETDYLSVDSGLSNVRGDKTSSLQASLSTTVFQRLSLTLTAARTRNSSDVAGFGFTSNQFGIQAALKY